MEARSLSPAKRFIQPSNGTFVPAYRRPIGMVFQSYAIWPHMTVFENVAFPATRRQAERFSNDEIRKKVRGAARTGRIGRLRRPHGDTAFRRPAAAARVGARARTRAAVLLLDEPLSNLDAKLRERMRVELRELQRRLRITTLYVTHDQIEALSMSNIIAVMNAGVIVQEGAPRDIYLQPKTKFVANFIGSTNQMAGQVTKRDGDGTGTVSTDDGEISCGILDDLTAGSKVVVVVRPESIELHQKTPPKSSNLIEGKIGAAMFLGEYVDCTIELGKNVLQTHQRSPYKSAAAIPSGSSCRRASAWRCPRK